MIDVLFYSETEIDDELLEFAVIIAVYQNKYIFCRHQERVTWEVPGGHREIGETIFEAAERELREETGACEFEIFPVSVYGIRQAEKITYGKLFFAKVERLQKSLPVHAYLVLPLYKMKAQRVGYDILSFDDNGMPVYLEVKTSCESEGQFVMTKNELDIAQRFTDEGKQYKIVVINNWGKEEMLIQDIPFGEFLTNHNITSKRYVCAPKRSCNTHMTGLAYFRRLRGLKEREIAEALDIPQYKWSLYETGDREPPVKLLLCLSELLDATVDELLGKYSVDSI